MIFEMIDYDLFFKLCIYPGYTMITGTFCISLQK